MRQPTIEQRVDLQRRPKGRSPVMFQSWKQLLFLHWEIDPGIVQLTLPPGLFVDRCEGKAYVGIVPFLMRRIRPRGLFPVPYISNFLECNVRTYVHDENGVPGVWFYSLDTNRWLAYKIARLMFHLPYNWASMSAEISDDVSYRVRRRDLGSDDACFQYASCSAERGAEPGSLEFFLLERYLLFAHDSRRGRLFKGQVHHEPYQFADADVPIWSSKPIEWVDLPPAKGSPVHACMTSSVAVSIFALEPVTSR